MGERRRHRSHRVHPREMDQLDLQQAGLFDRNPVRGYVMPFAEDADDLISSVTDRLKDEIEKVPRVRFFRVDLKVERHRSPDKWHTGAEDIIEGRNHALCRRFRQRIHHRFAQQAPIAHQRTKGNIRKGEAVIATFGRRDEARCMLIEGVQPVPFLAQPYDMAGKVDERQAMLDHIALIVVDRIDQDRCEKGAPIIATAWDFQYLTAILLELGLDVRLRRRLGRIIRIGKKESEGLGEKFAPPIAGQSQEAVIGKDDRVSRVPRIGEQHRHARLLGSDHEGAQRLSKSIDFDLCLVFRLRSLNLVDHANQPSILCSLGFRNEFSFGQSFPC
ncbi:MAG: hypothetical protein WC804_22405 [Sphingomonas sp.]